MGPESCLHGETQTTDNVYIAVYLVQSDEHVSRLLHAWMQKVLSVCVCVGEGVGGVQVQSFLFITH